MQDGHERKRLTGSRTVNTSWIRSRPKRKTAPNTDGTPGLSDRKRLHITGRLVQSGGHDGTLTHTHTHEFSNINHIAGGGAESGGGRG